MEQTPILERLGAGLRAHPFAVDVATTGVAVLVLVLLPAPSYTDKAESLVLGLLFVVPLAWRRRAPVPAAAAMVLAGLLQVATLPSVVLADVAALVMVYSLAAYAPRWAARGGLVGAFLIGARWYSYDASYGGADPLVMAVAAAAIAVVAAWALGDLRRARLLRVSA